MHFARLANTLLKDDESERDNHVFDDNFAKYSPILTSSYCQTRQWTFPNIFILLTTSPHFKYAATRPCKLSLT